MYGLLCEINFVICLGLIELEEGKKLMFILEKELFILYELFMSKK